MKLFQIYKKLLPVFLGYNKTLELYGIRPSNLIQKVFCRVFNLSGYVLIVTGIFASSGSLIYMASTLQEYIDDTIIFTAFLNDSILFLSLKSRYENVLKLIESFEKLVEIRKQNK